MGSAQAFFTLLSCIFIYVFLNRLRFNIHLKRSCSVSVHHFCFVTSCKCFAGFRRQWFVCFVTEPLIELNFSTNKTISISCQLISPTSPISSLLSSSLSLCFCSLTPHSTLASCTDLHLLPLFSLALFVQFPPQRWGAESYNYPSVCEMNHWVTGWAARWETSILSSLTERSQPSPPSFCWCPGLARVHAPCHCWGRQGVVCKMLHAVKTTITNRLMWKLEKF